MKFFRNLVIYIYIFCILFEEYLVIRVFSREMKGEIDWVFIG